MAKQSGLGDRLFVSGVDLSGDTQSVGNISGGPEAMDVTSIDKLGYERLGGLRSGQIEWVSFLNKSTGQAHPTLKTLPTTDRVISYLRGTSLGSPSANLIAKQLNYDPSRGADGMLTMAVSAQSNGTGIEWGEQLTAGKTTITGAASGTGLALSGTFSPFLYTPGTVGNYASTPDTAVLDITGDLDIIAKVTPDDWTPATDAALVSKYVTTGAQRSYRFNLLTTGALNLQFSNDGTTQISKLSTANLSTLANNSTKWVRVTLDVDNGASGYDVKFYTSDDGVTWTQLGNTVTTATATSIFAGTAPLELGASVGGTATPFAGRIHEAIVKNGIGGTEVAHPVATLAGITDATGKVWTVNGTAYLSDTTPYGLQAYLHVFSFTGTDATIAIQSSNDNGSTDTWTNVTGGGFTTVTTGPTTERIVTSATADVERYLRVNVTTSGGFTNLVYAVSVVRNYAPTTF